VKGKGRKSVVLAAAAGSGLAVGGLAFTDDIKHGYKAAERTGRVAGALIANINEYVPL
jgi:aarF domain-containing kinase